MQVDIKSADTAFTNQNLQFCNNIDTYASVLGLDAEKVTALKKASAFIQFVFAMQLEIQGYAHSFTSYKHQLHFGPSTELMGDLPKAPVYPTVPVPASQGNVRSMFASLAQDCVNSTKFTNDIGIALGIMDPVEAGKNIAAVKPNLTVKLTTGGHPILHTIKGIYDGYEVWKDSNDTKGYVKLDTSMYPDYTDNSPLPTVCLLYTSPSPRDGLLSRMPSSA